MISIQLLGFGALRYEIEKKARISFEPVLRKSGLYMLTIVTKRFETENQRQWQKMGIITALLRRKGQLQKFSSWKDVEFARARHITLSDTGRLRLSLMPYRTTQDSVRKYSKNEAIIGTNVRYARLMQYGGTTVFQPEFDWEKRLRQNCTKEFRAQVYPIVKSMIGKTYEIPARPFLYFSSEDVRKITSYIAEYLRRVWRLK